MSEASVPNPAQVYDDYQGPALATPSAKILLERASIKRGESVLDLACGTGRATRLVVPLLGESGYLAALDISSAMLSVARAVPQLATASVDWREGDAGDLPFPENTFDLVVCNQGLQFFPDREGALREVRRVLKSGGRFVANTWFGLDRQPVRGPLLEAIANRLGVPTSAASPQFSLGEEAELRSLLEEAGFQEVDISVHTIDAHYDSFTECVEKSFIAAAAFVPAFADLGQKERSRIVSAVNEEMATTLAQYIDVDGAFNAPQPTNVAVART